jgi:myo-inosose-2 dehydratase
VSLRLGINPITWSNDDLPRLGGNISLETCLSQARAAGYEGIELGSKFPREPGRLREVLGKHGLGLVSGWYSGRLCEQDEDAEFRAMQPHMELLRALGVDLVIFAETTRCIHGDFGAPLRLRPCLSEANWPVFTRRIGALARRMRDAGMRLAYHHHMGTVVQSRADVDRLMQETPDAVELLLDTGHLTFAGADPVDVARAYAGRIGHVHCKDVRRYVLDRSLNRNASFLQAVVDGVFTVPGDGCVDYAGVLEPVAHAGYRGWLVVEAEQDPAVAPSAEYATLGYRNLRRLADAQAFA